VQALVKVLEEESQRFEAAAAEAKSSG